GAHVLSIAVLTSEIGSWPRTGRRDASLSPACAAKAGGHLRLLAPSHPDPGRYVAGGGLRPPDAARAYSLRSESSASAHPGRNHDVNPDNGDSSVIGREGRANRARSRGPALA